MWHELLEAAKETLVMVAISGAATIVIGFLLGWLLSCGKRTRFLPLKLTYNLFSLLVETITSIPYIIFMIALIPITQWIIGKQTGIDSIIISLIIATIPIFAKLISNAFNTVPDQLISTAKNYGATPKQVLTKVLIPETAKKIIQAITKTIVTLINYSTIAGTLGASGLGFLVFEKGYQTFNVTYVVSAIIILISMNQIVRLSGNAFAKNLR